MELLKCRAARGRFFRLRGHYKNSFFRGVKNGVFLFERKRLTLLVETVFFSQRFIKEENRVNPTGRVLIQWSCAEGVIGECSGNKMTVSAGKRKTVKTNLTMDNTTRNPSSPQPMPLIEKTWVNFLGEGMEDSTCCDTIRYQGKLWLVPAWFDRRDTGTSRPVRLICLDALQYQAVPMSLRKDFDPCQYMLNQPFPRDAYEGRAPLIAGGSSVVVEMPNVEFHNPALLN